jgi:hypothetical protein
MVETQEVRKTGSSKDEKFEKQEVRKTRSPKNVTFEKKIVIKEESKMSKLKKSNFNL